MKTSLSQGHPRWTPTETRGLTLTVALGLRFVARSHRGRRYRSRLSVLTKRIYGFGPSNRHREQVLRRIVSLCRGLDRDEASNAANRYAYALSRTTSISQGDAAMGLRWGHPRYCNLLQSRSHIRTISLHHMRFRP